MAARAEIIDDLEGRFDALEFSEFRDATRVVVPQSLLMSVLRFLQSEHGFDLLVDITCVDYLNFRGATHRFGLAYLLASVATNDRLTVRVMLDEPDYPPLLHQSGVVYFKLRRYGDSQEMFERFRDAMA